MSAPSASLARCFIAFRAHFGEAFDLPFAHLGVIDIENVNRVFFFKLVFIHADDNIFTAVEPRLLARRGFLDALLGNTGFDGLDHAANFVHFGDEFFGMLHQAGGQRLNIIAAA